MQWLVQKIYTKPSKKLSHLFPHLSQYIYRPNSKKNSYYSRKYVIKFWLGTTTLMQPFFCLFDQNLAHPPSQFWLYRSHNPLEKVCFNDFKILLIFTQFDNLVIWKKKPSIMFKVSHKKSYLKYIEIRNLQTLRNLYFVFHRTNVRVTANRAETPGWK